MHRWRAKVSGLGAVPREELRPLVRAWGAVRVEPADSWYGPENGKGERWRWSPGRSELRIRNETGGPLRVAVRGQASALDERTLRVLLGDALVWSGAIERKPMTMTFGFVAPEGVSVLRFESDKGWLMDGTDPRKFSFRVFNLEFVVTPSDGPR